MLTIELVSKTCWFSNARSNSTDAQWNNLKRITSSKFHKRCGICGGVVECHEIWNYDDTNKIQKLDGLIALCPSCHQVKHMGLANIQGNGEIATKHLANVNKWSVEHAKNYVREQFLIWEERSQHDWVLDISWLEQYGVRHEDHERKETQNNADNIEISALEPMLEVENTTSQHTQAKGMMYRVYVHLKSLLQGGK